jgi:hypothetical protein
MHATFKDVRTKGRRRKENLAGSGGRRNNKGGGSDLEKHGNLN